MEVTKLFTAQSMAANAFSARADLSQHKGPLSFHVFWTGGTGTFDGVVAVEASNEDAPSATAGNWAPVMVKDANNEDVALTVAVGAATGKAFIELEKFAGRWVRLAFTKNQVTAGSLTGTLVTK